MIEVFVLIYLPSGKCYTYIMCRVWLWLSVFLQACGVLCGSWTFCVCVVCFGVLCICIDDYMHELYVPDLRRADVM